MRDDEKNELLTQFAKEKAVLVDKYEEQIKKLQQVFTDGEVRLTGQLKKDFERYVKQETQKIRKDNLKEFSEKNTNLTKKMNEMDQKHKKEIISLKEEFRKEKIEMRGDFKEELDKIQAKYIAEKEKAIEKFKKEQKELEKGISADHSKQFEIFKKKKADLEEQFEIEKAEICQMYMLERTELDERHKRTLDSQKLQLQKEIDKHLSTIKNLSASNDELNQQIKALRSELDCLKSQVLDPNDPNAQPSSIKALKMEINELTRQVVRCSSDKETLSSKCIGLEENITQLKFSNEDKFTQIQSLTKRNNLLEERSQKINQEKEDVYEARQKIEDERDNLQVMLTTEINDLKAEFSLKEENLKLLYDEKLCASEVEIKSVKRANKLLEFKLRDLKKINERLTSQQENQKEQLEEEEEEMISLQQEIYQLKKEKNDLFSSNQKMLSILQQLHIMQNEKMLSIDLLGSEIKQKIEHLSKEPSASTATTIVKEEFATLINSKQSLADNLNNLNERIKDLCNNHNISLPLETISSDILHKWTEKLDKLSDIVSCFSNDVRSPYPKNLLNTEKEIRIVRTIVDCNGKVISQETEVIKEDGGIDINEVVKPQKIEDGTSQQNNVFPPHSVDVLQTKQKILESSQENQLGVIDGFSDSETKKLLQATLEDCRKKDQKINELVNDVRESRKKLMDKNQYIENALTENKARISEIPQNDNLIKKLYDDNSALTIKLQTVESQRLGFETDLKCLQEKYSVLLSVLRKVSMAATSV